MTRALTFDNLSAAHAAFLTHYLELGGRPEHGPEAAKRAGLAANDDDAEQTAAILLGSERIARALKQAISHRLTMAAGAALKTMIDLCASGRSEQVRLAAAKELMDRGFGPVVSRSASLTATTSIEDLLLAFDANEVS